MTEPTDPSMTPADGLDAEALRAERDALAAEVEGLQKKTRRGKRARGVLAVIGVVVSCLLVLTAALGVWARRSFLKTDVFSARAGSLVEDPGVQTALAAYLTDQINALIDAESILEDTLPERAAVLAVPLSGAVEGFVGDQVLTFVESDTFDQLWKGAVEVAHREAVRVLSGDTPLLEESEDRIVINLLPVVNEVLATIGEASPEIFGREVDLPTVTVDDVPDAARDAIADALGVTLDEDFGTFTIYDDGALTTVQEVVSWADRLAWALVVLAPLAIAGTLLVSPRRRRTLLQVSIGIAASMVLVRRLVFLVEDDLLALVRVERNVPAVEATADAFLGPLLDGALWIGLIALAVALVALLTGPYGWAVSLRTSVARGARWATDTVSGKAQDPATVEWATANVDRLRVGGAVVGVALLWWLDLSWLGFLALAALVAAYELALSRLVEEPAAEDDLGDADAITPSG